ncbi:unnamed protein product [Urochloa humidicola]
MAIYQKHQHPQPTATACILTSRMVLPLLVFNQKVAEAEAAWTWVVGAFHRLVVAEVAVALPCQQEGASCLVAVASQEACTGPAVASGVALCVEEQTNPAARASALEEGIVQQVLVVAE